MFYSKYKWIIIFLNDYFSFCNIGFLHKKSKATDTIKSITTSYSMKRLHTDNGGEYVTSELQSFLREQEVIHETNTLYVHQQNGCAEWLNCTLLEKTQSMQLEACLLDYW